MPGDPYTAIAAAGIQYEANDREHEAQQNDLNGYETAWRANNAGVNADQAALEAALGQSADAYDQNYSTLVNALGSPKRLQVAGDARTQLAQRISQNLAGAPKIQGRGFAGTNVASMADTAGQAYQPTISADKTLAGEELAAGAESNYDKNAFADFDSSNAAVAHGTRQAQSRARLMGLYRNNLLQDAAHRYKYQGPSNGYNNAMLLAQGLQVAGNGARAYSASGKPDGEDEADQYAAMYGNGGTSPYAEGNGE